jgi:aryl-alcohol dehydrogenase-like predicted oxidoreductase
MEPIGLGQTGLRVTRLGLGLAALGRPAYITLGRDRDLGNDRDMAAMERRCHLMLDAAYAAGIRYVDAARSYGAAEAFLASWLHARATWPEDLVVGSKWGYRYVGDWDLQAPVQEVKDHSLRALEEQRDESLAILGDALALYQIHSATLESGVLDDRGVLDALCELRRRGMRIGLSVSGPAQGDTIRRAMAIHASRNPFQTVQATWNVFERSAESALADAAEAGWGVLIKEVHANGRLTSRGDERTSPIEAIAEEHGATLDQVVLAFALVRPWVSVVLSGAVTPEQLRSHRGALALTLGAGDLDALDALVEEPAAYWATRSHLRWQ